jgi:hypothetical protein
VELVYPLDGLLVCAIGSQPIVSMYPLNDEYVPLELNLTGYVGSKPASAGIYPARLQRAPEGSGQSTSRCSHDVIKSGGVREEVIRGNVVMLGHFGVHAEGHRMIQHGETRPPLRTL